MAQTVSLKLDNALNTPSAEVSKSLSAPDNQAFNAEFDRQIKRDNSPAESFMPAKKAVSVSDTAATKEAGKAEKIELTEDTDGNNLPLDTEAQPISTNETQPEKAAAVAENIVVAEVDLLSETVTPTLVNVSPSLVLQSDKNARAANFATLTSQQIADKLSVNTALTTQNNKSATPLAIRADILQAITQNVVKTSTDSQQTLKNVMHAITQNADAKMPSAVVSDIVRQIQTGSGGQERPAALPLFSGFTPLSSTTASPSSAPLALDVQPGLNQPNWSRVVSSRVVYMAREGVQHAELRLNPAQLGPVEVRLSVVNEQTSVTFLANNAATREALEQALPRLRESFAESGLALSNAEVGQQDQSQNPQQDEAFTTQEGRIIQVSTELDDIEDVTPALRSEQQELGSGVSLYA